MNKSRILTSITSVLALAGGISSQTPLQVARDLPALDTVSVKATDYPCNGGGLKLNPGGRITAACTLPLLMISAAYDIVRPDIQLAGLPAWVSQDGFAIEAKAVTSWHPDGLTNVEQFRLLLQAVLVDRFHLTIEQKTKYLRVLILSNVEPNRTLRPAIEAEDGPHVWTVGFTGVSGKNVTIDQIAGSMMRSSSDRFIVNQTGLDGRYDVQGGQSLSEFNKNADNTSLTRLSPQQIAHFLGLRLDAGVGPVPVYTVLTIRKPLPN